MAFILLYHHESIKLLTIATTNSVGGGAITKLYDW